MINLIISLALGAAAWVLSVLFIFDSVWAGILPFIVVSLVALVILNRKTAQKVTAIMNKTQEMMLNLPKLPTESARTHLMDKAVEALKEAYAYKNYQFFLEGSLNAQIGMVYYVQNRVKEAEPYLANAFIQQGVAVAMYGCILYKRGEKEKMVKTFDKVLKINRKQPLLYNLYAWCLLQLKDRDAAIKALNDCLLMNPGDQTTKDNLDLVKNSGKIKMRGYNEQWYQFRLEDPPMQKIQAQFGNNQMFRR